MADKTSKVIKTKKKRLSKSERTHVRRLKQEGAQHQPGSQIASYTSPHT